MSNEQTETVLEPKRGNKGNIGTGSPSSKIKDLWHSSCFKRVSNHDHDHPNRTKFVPVKGFMSLKQFSKSLKGENEFLAQEWVGNKTGQLNQVRSENNIKRIILEKQAKKSKKKD